MKILLRNWLILFFVILSATAFSQSESITLQQCQQMAVNNYPLVRNTELLKQSEIYSVANVKSGYFPTISIQGQYTYQSDVTGLPITIPGMNIPELDKEQYKIYLEVSQAIYDGGVIKNQKNIAEADAQTESRSNDAELYKVKERVNNLYFGILLIEGQLSQTDLMKKDILDGIKKTEALYAQGVVLKSQVDALRAELLKVEQKEIELKAAKTSYIGMMSYFTNITFTPDARFEVPETISIKEEITRPELSVFDARLKSLSYKSKLVTARNLPKLNLLFQGGYGRPALNMLNPDADTYYLAGLKFVVPVSGFYNHKRDKALIDIAMQNINNQRETFLFNTRMQALQQQSETEKNIQLSATDNEIIELREAIKQTSLTQLENGVITSSDYVREVIAADNARQVKLIHEIQILLSQYNQQLINGQ
jgi:outer membrane protein TolC